MSEFIKCDGCGKMIKKKGDAAEDWSIIGIKTCRGKLYAGNVYEEYHVCPSCHQKIMDEILSLSGIEHAGVRRL